MTLKTKSGRLTRYGLACGYVESAKSIDGVMTAKMWMEHGVIFTGLYYLERLNDFSRTVHGWEKVMTARARFDHYVSAYNMTRNPI